jgi:hypothetical protein
MIASSVKNTLRWIAFIVLYAAIITLGLVVFSGCSKKATPIIVTDNGKFMYNDIEYEALTITYKSNGIKSMFNTVIPVQASAIKPKTSLTSTVIIDNTKLNAFVPTPAIIAGDKVSFDILSQYLEVKKRQKTLYEMYVEVEDQIKLLEHKISEMH